MSSSKRVVVVGRFEYTVRPRSLDLSFENDKLSIFRKAGTNFNLNEFYKLHLKPAESESCRYT